MDGFDGFLLKHRHLIHDRDLLFRGGLPALLRSAGVEPVMLPPHSPILNAYAERFVRSIKEECLSKIIPIGERHLRHAIEEHVPHYHLDRNHQGRGNRLIDGEAQAEPADRSAGSASAGCCGRTTAPRERLTPSTSHQFHAVPPTPLRNLGGRFA